MVGRGRSRGVWLGRALEGGVSVAKQRERMVRSVPVALTRKRKVIE